MTSTQPRMAIFVVFAIIAALLAAMAAAPTGAAQPSALTPAQAETIALDHLSRERHALGFGPLDVADVVVTDVVPVGAGAAVYLQQRLRGIEIAGAVMTVTVDGGGQVVELGNRFLAGVGKLNPAIAPGRTARQAADAAVDALGFSTVRPRGTDRARPGRGQQRTIDADGVADGVIPARLVLAPRSDGSVRLAWQLTVDPLSEEGVWQVTVDAATGQELERIDLTRHASYRVYGQPVEAPSFGVRSLVVDPADPVASPFGWHDTDGVAGAEFTTTQGNNVDAYLDVDANQVPDPGGRPDGGAGLVFDHPLDLAKQPVDYQQAAVTNLFYWTNRLHDVLYAFGFDEASGNFQVNNYGNGGVGNDAVRAEAQDGFTTNNANFFTPADGSPPRMQLYLFTATVPRRDPSLDAGVIAHEYAHGLSDRLTGGPSMVTCLTNNEAPGEGWSDFVGLMTTMRASDIATQRRGFGTYVLGQPTTGIGLRAFPYSTDLATDPRTYGSITTAAIPHGVGSVWGAMLWELAWSFIERDGFAADLINGSGGNITAMQLVVDALKIQPCSPGFVDARNAILAADVVRTGGADRCLIWEAFAKRGLGFSATQGSVTSIIDGVQAFDVPPECTDLELVLSASPNPAQPATTLTYTVDVTNTSASTLTGVTVTQGVPAGTTFVPGSATCAGSELGGVVTLTPGTIAASATTPCSFAVTVAPGPGTLTLLADDVESGTGKWTLTHGAGTADWAPSTAFANSAVTSLKGTNAAQISDQYLTTAAPIPVTAATELRFWHRFVTENTWDGGVVEASTNGVDWFDLGPVLSQNGYLDLLRPSNNPLSGRLAFTGNSGGWVQTTADLSAWAGSSLHLRFRFGSDSTIGADGWYIDDVQVVDPVEVVLDSSAGSGEGPIANASLTTPVLAPVGPGFLRVTTNPAVPSVIDVDGLWTDAFGLDWVEHAPGGYQLCFSDVPGFTSPPCQTATVVSGVTTAVQGAFVTHGTLDIVTSPAVVSTITVDGVPVNDWGAIVSAEPGIYNVCFGLVADFTPPACQAVSVAPGATTNVTGVFTPSPGAPGPGGFGNLRVTTSPAVPSQLVIDGTRTVSFGLDWMKLPPGPHQVCFTDVPGFATPPCQTADVVAGATTVLQGTFAPLAGLRILTSPPANVPITVDGRVVDQYGLWTWVPPGVAYDICAAGYVCQSVTPPASTLTTVTLVPGP